MRFHADTRAGTSRPASGAAKALSGWHLDGGALLPAWAGGLLFLAYAAVLGCAAQVLTTRRDVT